MTKGFSSPANSLEASGSEGLDEPRVLLLGLAHFSHPFLGTCEVYEFFDLGVPQWYPFQGGI